MLISGYDSQTILMGVVKYTTLDPSLWQDYANIHHRNSTATTIQNRGKKPVFL